MIDKRKLTIVILSCSALLLFIGAPKLIRSNLAFNKNKSLIISEISGAENVANGLLQFPLNISTKDMNRVVFAINGIESNIDYVDESLKRIDFLKRSPELLEADSKMLLIASGKKAKGMQIFTGSSLAKTI